MEDNKQGNNKPSKSNDEEIDLGQLFSLIGKGFSNLFGFFGNLITKFFDWIIRLALIIRRNFIFITSSSLIGLMIGLTYQTYVYIPKYESSMSVKPNFGSTIQLYKNIDYYQNLVSLRDYSRLSESLNITEEEAKNIESFEVEPYSNVNQSIKAYGRFLTSLDSMVVNDITLDEFVENQPIESFEYHIVKVKSKDRYIFPKIGNIIINSIEKNEFYRNERDAAYINIETKISSIKSSIVELDALRKIRKEILIRESEKKVGSGTNIYMSTKEGGIEVSYLDYKSLNDDLSKANRDLITNKKVITIVSNFDNIGSKEKKWFINFYFLGFFVGFVLSFSYISIKSANTKLKAIEEENK